MVSTKQSLDAAGMEESLKFLWAGQLFVCCCLGHMQATSGSPVVRSQALQLSVCLCVAPRTHVTEGRLENPPSSCNQHQRRRQYLRIPHALPPTGVLALTIGLSAEAGKWSNFPKVQLTWHHGNTLKLIRHINKENKICFTKP